MGLSMFDESFYKIYIGIVLLIFLCVVRVSFTYVRIICYIHVRRAYVTRKPAERVCKILLPQSSCGDYSFGFAKKNEQSRIKTRSIIVCEDVQRVRGWPKLGGINYSQLQKILKTNGLLTFIINHARCLKIMYFYFRIIFQNSRSLLASMYYIIMSATISAWWVHAISVVIT